MIGVASFTHDISERKRLEAKLRQSEGGEFPGDVHRASTVMLLIDPDTDAIVDSNQAATTSMATQAQRCVRWRGGIGRRSHVPRFRRKCSTHATTNGKH